MPSKLNPRLTHANHRDAHALIALLPTLLPLPPFIPTTFMTFPSIDFTTANVPQEYGTPIDIYPVSCGHVLFSPSVVRSDGLGFRSLLSLYVR